MRSHFVWTAGLAGLIVVAARCGGSTAPPGNASDASVDGSSGSSGGGSGSSSGSGSDAGDCAMGCVNGESCCDSQCVQLLNDPFHCGVCNNRCPAERPTCGGGSCEVPPCDSTPPSCSGGQFCCGANCCNAGDLCCIQVGGPISNNPDTCLTPSSAQPTCSPGCPACQ